MFEGGSYTEEGITKLRKALKGVEIEFTQRDMRGGGDLNARYR